MCGTCFSIEPGVYLKGKFGVRSEVNVYLAEQEAIVTGQPVQEHVVPILSL
jgi:Xaa-Pro aminopeptidase